MRALRIVPATTLARQVLKEHLTAGNLLLFTLLGAGIALVPGAEIGGRNAALTALGALVVIAALHVGLGGVFTPGGLFRSAWLHAHPPGRMGRNLAVAGGVWLALGMLLAPALLLPLPGWSTHGGESRHPVPIAALGWRPGPSGVLARPGAEMRIDCTADTQVEQLRFALRSAMTEGEFTDIRLRAKIDDGPWINLPAAGLEPEYCAFGINPPRRLHSLRLQRIGPSGQAAILPVESIRLLGSAQPAWAAWGLTWLTGWHLATAAALALGLLGSLLSRPVALLVAAAWAVLALAEPAFMPGFSGPHVASGLALGADLEGGWLLLACALVLALGLGMKPGAEGES